MKIYFKSTFVLSAALFGSGLAFAEKLQVDPAHSTINFEVEHFKLSKIPGRFTEFTGNIDLDSKDIKKSKIDFTVQVASINTSVNQRDEHLRSPDFFDAKKFPQATFKSTAIKKDDDDEYKLEGNLTIRGVTKKVTFEMKSLGKVQDPAMKVEKTLFSAEGKINRKDFGVSYGPDELISDYIELEINLETVAAK